jgi:hypothetical protein
VTRLTFLEPSVVDVPFPALRAFAQVTQPFLRKPRYAPTMETQRRKEDHAHATIMDHRNLQVHGRGAGLLEGG